MTDTQTSVKILIVDDDPVMREMISAVIRKRMGFEAVVAKNGQQALQIIKSESSDAFSAVLLDIAMPGMDGFETLREIRSCQPELPVLMLTGNSDIASSVKAIKQGAQDFISKPVEPAHLEVSLKNSLRLSAMAKELTRFKRDKAGAMIFSDLVGYDEGLEKAVFYGKKAAASDVPVLITGETGVGKELLARAIHGESKRVGAPFIAVNCGAIPINLLESTLFGHEKGSFTGAVLWSAGKFREAEGGTIFLDEIGDLPFEAQVKILRVLQQNEVEPVGGGKPVRVNVRIISATNRDLKADVKSGRFREDLFFRLNVFPIRVPSLRERKQDIVKLVQRFIERESANGLMPIKTLSPEAREYLRAYDWPGNVRELENLIRRILVLGDGDIISRDDLREYHDISGLSQSAQTSPSGMLLAMQYPDGSLKTMDQIEGEAIEMAFRHFQGNISLAAAELGIAKSTFYRKIKQLNLHLGTDHENIV